MNNSLFSDKDTDAIGQVYRPCDPDRGMWEIRGNRDRSILRILNCGDLVSLHTRHPGDRLIGIICDIDGTGVRDCTYRLEICFFGTLIQKRGHRSNLFVQHLETAPEISALCFLTSGLTWGRLVHSILLGFIKDQPTLFPQ